MNSFILTIIIFLAAINFLSFVVMIYDKDMARSGRQRVSEGALFFLAIFFGGLGIYVGMAAFHHKNRKWYFYLGIPLIMIQNFCCLVLLYEMISGACLVISR